jgi:ribosomal-protein-alanine N-acetyltransferase
MEILTQRLRLRPLFEKDIEELVSLDADSEVMRGSSGFALPRNRVGTVEWLQRTLSISTKDAWLTFRVDDRLSGAFLGRCGLRPEEGSGETELAYAFAQLAWGRGIATESASVVVNRGFESGLTRIVGSALAANLASLRVLEKIGMRRTREDLTSAGIVIHHELDRPGPPTAVLERRRPEHDVPRGAYLMERLRIA